MAGLKRGAQVVVGTPGRVIDHLDKGSLDLSHLDYLVLDEADEMLQMVSPRMSNASWQTPRSTKQVALFSATMPPGIKKITTNWYLHDPVEVTVKSKTQTAENITQRYFLVSYLRKMDALTRLLEVEQGDAMIVFVRTKQATEEVAEKLRARGRRRRPSMATFAGGTRAHHLCAWATARSTSWSPRMSRPAALMSSGSARGELRHPA